MKGDKWADSFALWKRHMQHREAFKEMLYLFARRHPRMCYHACESDERTPQQIALWHIRKQRMVSRIIRKCRQATKADYDRWLTGFVRHGKMPTQYHDRPTCDSGLLIAEADFAVCSLYGAAAMQIIVPEGICVSNVRHSGHSRFYLMDGFSVINGYAVCFRDTEMVEREESEA